MLSLLYIIGMINKKLSVGGYVMKKTCTKCGEVKKLDEYHIHATNSDGRRNDCKVCNNKARQKRRVLDPVKAKAYYDDNREYIITHARQFRKDNKEKLSIKRKEKYRLTGK